LLGFERRKFGSHLFPGLYHVCVWDWALRLARPERDLARSADDHHHSQATSNEASATISMNLACVRRYSPNQWMTTERSGFRLVTRSDLVTRARVRTCGLELEVSAAMRTHPAYVGRYITSGPRKRAVDGSEHASNLVGDRGSFSVLLSSNSSSPSPASIRHDANQRASATYVPLFA
jgi:hypothetical protein